MASNGWGTAQKFYNYNRKVQSWNSYTWSSSADSVTYTVTGYARSGDGTGSWYAQGYTARVQLYYKIGSGSWVKLGNYVDGTLNYNNNVGNVEQTITIKRASTSQKITFATDVTSPSGYWPLATSQSPDTMAGLATYTVTYNANGGGGAPASQTKTRGTALKLSSTKPTWAGRKFLKWNTAKNGTGTSYNAGGSYTSDANVTLYAQWQLNTYTITYDANGGDGAPSPQTKTHGTPIKLSTTTPTLDDYTFVGWATTQAATTAGYEAGAQYTTDASVTLYAVWEFSGTEDEDGIPTRNCVIVNAERGAVMGITQSSAGRGAYLQLCDWWDWDGYKFAVKFDSDDTVRIINKFGGRTIDADAGALEQGLTACIRLWDIDDSRVQRWRLKPTGETITFNGKSLKTYYIETVGDQNIVIDADATSGAVGSLLKLSEKDGLLDQKWAFWTTPLVSDGGLYELRSMVNTSRCAQVQSDSKASGARLVVGDADGSSGDKFWLAKRDDGSWSIVCAETSLSLKVDSDYVSGTTNHGISQMPTDDTDSERWSIYQVGKTEVEGVECAVVEFGSYTATDPTTLVMDVSRCDVTSDSRIIVYAHNGNNNQRWALSPTTLSSSAVPVPANVGATLEAGAYPSYSTLRMGERFYPCWDCTDAWTTPRPNHFEMRYDWQAVGPSGDVLPNGGGVYTDDGSAWTTAEVVRDGTRAWLADGIRLPEGYYQNWEMFYHVSVRCVTQVEDADGVMWNSTGSPAFGEIRLYRVPKFTVLAVGLSPEGLRIGYQSDYDIGRLSLSVLSINDVESGAEYLIGGDIQFASLDESGSVLIPYTRVSSLSGNKNVRLTYQIGTDQMRSMPDVYTEEVNVVYNSGWDDEWSSSFAKPEISYDRLTRTLSLKMQHIGVERAWLGNGVGSAEALSGVTSGAWTTFTTTATTAGDQYIFTTCYDPSQDRWGTYYEFIGEGSYFSRLYPPAHVWTWGKGNEHSFVLEADVDPVQTQRTFEPVYAEHIVNKRKRSVVTFSSTVRSEFEVNGAIYDGVTAGTVDGLIELVEAKHAVYTAPSGEKSNVAIVGASYNRRIRFTTAKVQMIEESV